MPPKYKSLDAPKPRAQYASIEQGPPAPDAAPEAPGLATHAEGADAFLRDSTGAVVRVPRELAGRYVAEQGYLPATAEDTEKAKMAAETSAAGEFVREAGATLTSGIGFSVRLPSMIADLAGVDRLPEVPSAIRTPLSVLIPGLAPLMAGESPADFVRDTSPTGVRAAFATAWDAIRSDTDPDKLGAADAWDDSLRRNRVYEELFPTARMLGRTTGDVGAGLLLGGPLGTWAGAGRGALGVAARSAVAAGAEGAATASLDEYRASMLENRAVDREHVISNGLIGGVLSAAAGGVLGGAGKKLSDALGARRAAGVADDAARAAPEPTTPTRARAVASTERAVAEAADELDRPAVELEQQLAEAQAKVAKAAQDAGVNPNAQRAAAEAAAEREAKTLQDIAGADYDPKLWRDAATDRVKPIRALLHRDAILSGGSDELTREGDAMLGGTRALFRELQEVPLKKAHIAKAFARDGIDETAAIATAMRQQETFGEALAEVTSKLEAQGMSGTKAAKGHLRSLNQAHSQAMRAVANAPSAADAFIARDQFRRFALKEKNLIDDYVRKGLGDPNDFRAARELQPFVNDEYHRAVSTLNDQATWKSYGAFQEAVNGHDGWVGVIKADKIGLRNFADVVDMGEGQDYGREILGFNPEKVRAYLNKIDQPTLRDAEIRKIIEKRVSMVSTMREGLELSDAQKAVADKVIDSGKKMLSALDDAEKIAIRLNRQAKMNEADKLAIQGGVVTRLMAGLAKAASGDIKDAALLQVGGSELVAKQVQALRVQLHGSDSRIARGILAVINKASGEGSKNADALAKIERRARVGGIINENAERLANRMRDQNYALAPLFRPMWDRTASEQREAHARRREVLADLVANPETLQRAAEPVLARAMAASPQMGAQIAEEMKVKIDRLQAALPGQLMPSLFPAAASGQREMVSEQDLRTADAMISATIDPQSVFEDFERGHLDYEKLKFAKVQYPEMFEAARAMALDIFRELPADLQSNMATQLDFLLDFEGQLDPALSPDFLGRQEERFKLQQQKNAAGGGPKRPAPGKAAAGLQTYTERLQGV